MSKRSFLAIIIIFVFSSVIVYPKNVFSQRSCSSYTRDEIVSISSQDELNQIKKLCQNESNQAGNEISGYQSQLNTIESKRNSTLIQIKQTEDKIEQTLKEVDIISTRIDGLNSSLNILSKMLLNKIVENYKQRTISLFSLLFDSQNAEGLLTKIKYVKTTRDNDQRLLVQVQEAKSNFEEQKKLRETKKIELDQLNTDLAQLNIKLKSQEQQVSDLKLAKETQKSNIDSILAQAQAQLAGFKSFVSNIGAFGEIISANQFGTGSDGSYFSQRDARWANQNIANSSENILSVGCLLTSVSMVAKHLGDNVTPSSIASDVSRFYGSTAYMSLPWKSVGGRSYYGGINVDQELANNNYVIVGVGGCANGGSHFVVLIKKDGNDYIMHDPIYGPDLKFSSHYSGFCSTATFK